jgi:uncharacterized membrane protein YphA (DoxX/SURF4 family)
MMNVILEPKRIKRTRIDRSSFDSISAKVARFIFGSFFVYSGLDNLMNLFITAERIDVPAAVLIVTLGALFKIFMGTALALRYHTKYAAISLAIYLLIVSVVFYGPQHWAEFDIYRYIFMRNITIFAGLIFIEANSRGYSFWQEEWIPESEKELLHHKEKHPPHPL